MAIGKMTRRSLLAGMGCLALASCASVPTSSPVTRVTGSAGEQISNGVQIVPDPPQDGDTPDLILAGFLSACLVNTNNYAVARQYLTPDAATAWRPEEQVSVYESESQPLVTTDHSALLRASLVGRIDSTGLYASIYQEDFDHDFQLTQVDGQWRISDPGDGIFVSRYELRRAFSSFSVYFLDRTGSTMVAQPMLVPGSGASATTIVQTLVKGPGTWLSPAVITALPDGTLLANPAVTVNDSGIAEVSLTDQITALGASQRVDLAAQLVWSLTGQNGITGVRLLSNGQSFSVSNTDAQGILCQSMLSAYSPVPQPDSPGVRVVMDDSIQLIRTESPNQLVVDLNPDLVSTVNRTAISATDSTVALVSHGDNHLVTLQPGSGDDPLIVAEGVALSHPHFTAHTLWALDSGDEHGDGAALVMKPEQGEAARLSFPELPGRPIAAKVSPGDARVAMIIDGADGKSFGYCRLRGEQDLVVDGWREVPLVGTRGLLTGLIDLDWISPTSLVVLAQPEQTTTAKVYQVDLDATHVESLGPTTDIRLVGIAGLTTTSGITAAALTEAGDVMVYQDGSRWIQLGEGARDICYPG